MSDETQIEHVVGQTDFEGNPTPEPHHNPVWVQIDVTGLFDLTVGEVWPDGEPEKWTAEDVAAAIKKDCRSALGLLRDWDLDDLDVTVSDSQHKTVRVEFR